MDEYKFQYLDEHDMNDVFRFQTDGNVGLATGNPNSVLNINMDHSIDESIDELINLVNEDKDQVEDLQIQIKFLEREKEYNHKRIASLMERNTQIMERLIKCEAFFANHPELDRQKREEEKFGFEKDATLVDYWKKSKQ